ncbi:MULTISPECIES: hypothetical protein [unclassified Streptomyces]|uniref:hypothetical protein n=1 Tax=unclassified Streptomyces TaxID=2593676 RepID=UPI00382ED446
MNALDRAHEDDACPADAHTCRIDFQAGWVDLTLAEVSRHAAAALASEQVGTLDPLTLKSGRKQIVHGTADRPLRLNEDEPVLAAA